jgi:hypothetical protein
MSDNVGDLIFGLSPKEVVDSKAHKRNIVCLNPAVKSRDKKNADKT